MIARSFWRGVSGGLDTTQCVQQAVSMIIHYLGFCGGKGCPAYNECPPPFLLPQSVSYDPFQQGMIGYPFEVHGVFAMHIYAY